MSLTSILFRYNAKRSDGRRDAGLKTPADIERFNGIAYGSYGDSNLLDIYRPRCFEGKLPVIVSVHGGGWVYGSKEVYQYYCMSLAQMGFAVVNFNYRLAPAYKFPAPIEDTNAVFSWVLKNAEEYAMDASRIFAVGDSAGAHTLALYCAVCTNPAYAAELKICPPEGFVPKGIALNCGTYEIKIDRRNRRNSTTQLMGDYLPEKGSEREIELINALAQANGKFPPSFVMTCVGDFLATQGPLMAERLGELGVPVTYRLYGSNENPLGHVFHCNIRTEAAQQCNRDECDFFKSL